MFLSLWAFPSDVSIYNIHNTYVYIRYNSYRPSMYMYMIYMHMHVHVYTNTYIYVFTKYTYALPFWDGDFLLLSSNTLSSCFSLPGAGILCIYHHTHHGLPYFNWSVTCVRVIRKNMIFISLGFFSFMKVVDWKNWREVKMKVWLAFCFPSEFCGSLWIVNSWARCEARL